MRHSMDEIIKTEEPKYHFDIGALHSHIDGWKNMSLKLKKPDYLYNNGLCIEKYCDAVEEGYNALEFYSDKRSTENFFTPDEEHSKIRTCTIVDFEEINKGDIYLMNWNEETINLKDYLSIEADKKFDKYTHNICEGDLIWFRTRYYADNKKDRVIDITAVGFVKIYIESEMQITYRDCNNEIHEVSLRPELLRMFDWYLIDENKEYDKR